jgi:hypothetical protein
MRWIEQALARINYQPYLLSPYHCIDIPKQINRSNKNQVAKWYLLRVAAVVPYLLSIPYPPSTYFHPTIAGQEENKTRREIISNDEVI